MKVLVDGKEIHTIARGKTVDCSVKPGTHRVQVKQDLLRSKELSVRVEDGAVKALECGSYVEGWAMALMIWWAWKAMVPGGLFFVREQTGR